MNDNAFNDLSTFYLNLWQYLNTYFNDARWLQVHPNGTSKQDRFHLLEASLEKLRADQLDSTIDAQFEQDFARVSEMRREYKDFASDEISDWLKRADKLRVYAQELGLRYAEMSATV
jgi:hypothetical protein